MLRKFLILPTALAFIFAMSACSSSSIEESGSAPIKTCQAASEEDLTNINEGMISSKYKVASGFTADFSADDIEAIKQVFPSYVSPKVFAANIPGDNGESVVGLWGIQKLDFGWRITALNKQTQEFSLYGVEAAEGSASARVNAVMLELSVNTNVLSCLEK